MSAPRDKLGRPIVVVTGMGVVTSLGAGKKDNWTRLTAGESGIRTVAIVANVTTNRLYDAIAAIVRVGAGGKVCLFNSSPTHLIVDVNGYIPD